MEFNYKGTLQLDYGNTNSKDKTSMELDYNLYIENVKTVHISKILRQIYFSKTPNLTFEIAGVFCRSGPLYIDKNELGIFCFYIGDACLSNILWNHTGEEMEIVISTEAEVNNYETVYIDS